MVEKQASSEIARSRERFEKAGRHLGLSLFFAYGDPRGYVDPDTWKAFEMWQAAERDTRERCAQIVEREADHYQTMEWQETAQRLRQVTERILGKE